MTYVNYSYTNYLPETHRDSVGDADTNGFGFHSFAHPFIPLSCTSTHGTIGCHRASKTHTLFAESRSNLAIP
jgi:hypothetical protein